MSFADEFRTCLIEVLRKPAPEPTDADDPIRGRMLTLLASEHRHPRHHLNGLVGRRGQTSSRAA